MVDPTLAARRFFISGLVQGVGFRYFAQRAAARYQVKGYVRNLPDGRVEAFVEGPAELVEKFKQDLAAGPAHSRVDGVEEIVVEPTGSFSTFRIER
jgi:acylphosphatase